MCGRGQKQHSCWGGGCHFFYHVTQWAIGWFFAFFLLPPGDSRLVVTHVGVNCPATTAESACLHWDFTWLTALCSIPKLNFLCRSLQWLAGAFCLFFNWCHVEHHLRSSEQLLSAASAATKERETGSDYTECCVHISRKTCFAEEFDFKNGWITSVSLCFSLR